MREVHGRVSANGCIVAPLFFIAYSIAMPSKSGILNTKMSRKMSKSKYDEDEAKTSVKSKGMKARICG